MASTKPGYDGLLLSFNDKFLVNLIREKYTLSKIRFKFLTISGRNTHRTFATYQDFYTYFVSVLKQTYKNIRYDFLHKHSPC